MNKTWLFWFRWYCHWAWQGPREAMMQSAAPLDKKEPCSKPWQCLCQEGSHASMCFD